MHSIAWWPTLFVLMVATFTDLRSRRIPNWLVLPFLLAGIGVWVGEAAGMALGRAWKAWRWAPCFLASCAG